MITGPVHFHLMESRISLRHIVIIVMQVYSLLAATDVITFYGDRSHKTAGILLRELLTQFSSSVRSEPAFVRYVYDLHLFFRCFMTVSA